MARRIDEHVNLHATFPQSVIAAYRQGRSQEVTKGDKPKDLVTEVPSGVPKQNIETPENTNGAVKKFRTYGDGRHAPIPPSGYAPAYRR